MREYIEIIYSHDDEEGVEERLTSMIDCSPNLERVRVVDFIRAFLSQIFAGDTSIIGYEEE